MIDILVKFNIFLEKLGSTYTYLIDSLLKFDIVKTIKDIYLINVRIKKNVQYIMVFLFVIFLDNMRLHMGV